MASEVRTVEGLAGVRRPEPEPRCLNPLQQAFLETGGAQCGICTPGMLMAAQAYLDGGGDADEDAHPRGHRRQPLPLHGLHEDHRGHRAGRPRPLSCWQGGDGMDDDAYSVGMKATMGERGQVTIPKPVRDRLGLRPGQRLEVTDEAGRVVLVKLLDDEAVMRRVGTLKLPRSVDEVIEEMRGPANLPPVP